MTPDRLEKNPVVYGAARRLYDHIVAERERDFNGWYDKPLPRRFVADMCLLVGSIIGAEERDDA